MIVKVQSENKMPPTSKLAVVEAADFETAIAASGFGIFNILLLLVATMAFMANTFDSTTISYILPSAECDLRLTMLDKGILNAIAYAGMITSAIGWGYVADTHGRKKILIWGYLVDAVCVFGGALSQNKVQLMVFKYIGGFVMCGPYAVLLSYLTEFHGKLYRQRIMMIVGMIFSFSSLMLTVLAILILPNSWEFSIWNLKFSSWKMFVAVTAFPSILAGVLIPFFPESPKFLMSQGRNTEAMEAFQTVYVLNTRKSKDSYPIKSLVNEIETQQKCFEEENSSEVTAIATVDGIKMARSLSLGYDNKINKEKKSKLQEGLTQLRPLIRKPYLQLSLQVYLINFFLLMYQNTIRLWLPQLFASTTEYENITGLAPSMCTILDYNLNKTTLASEMSPEAAWENCEVIITVASYTNNIIVAVCGFCGYIVTVLIINKIGGKVILVFGIFIAAICGLSLYWSSSAQSTLIISAIAVTMGSISSTSLISSSINLFPTALRTMIVSLAMMFGRVGSLTGNLLFPILVSMACIAPFAVIGTIMFIASILAIILPSANKTALK